MRVEREKGVEMKGTEKRREERRREEMQMSRRMNDQMQEEKKKERREACVEVKVVNKEGTKERKGKGGKGRKINKGTDHERRNAH